jgi:hypothetical protein
MEVLDLIEALEAMDSVRFQIATYDKHTGAVGEPLTFHVDPILGDLRDVVEKARRWDGLVATGRAIFQAEDPFVG